jgi:hypothetical protein
MRRSEGGVELERLHERERHHVDAAQRHEQLERRQVAAAVPGHVGAHDADRVNQEVRQRGDQTAVETDYLDRIVAKRASPNR